MKRKVVYFRALMLLGCSFRSLNLVGQGNHMVVCFDCSATTRTTGSK